MRMFRGYRRPKGLPGMRNVVAIIPSVFCANNVNNKTYECMRFNLDFNAGGIYRRKKHP